MKIYLLNLIKRKKFWIFFNRIEQTNNYIHRKPKIYSFDIPSLWIFTALKKSKLQNVMKNKTTKEKAAKKHSPV